MKAYNAFFMVALLLCLLGTTLSAQPETAPQQGIKKQDIRKGHQGMDMKGLHPRAGQGDEDGIQPPPCGDMQLPPPAIPGLTKDQSDKMTKIHISTTKKIIPLEAQIREKEAHLQLLSIADNPDGKAMDVVIDEISDLRGSIMKAHNTAKQEVRKLLTDEQRTCFDQLPPPRLHGPQDQPGPHGQPGPKM